MIFARNIPGLALVCFVGHSLLPVSHRLAWFMSKAIVYSAITALWVAVGCSAEPGTPEPAVLFEDGFDKLRTGLVGSEVGAHAEYHYLPEVDPKGNWSIAAFAS